MPGAMKEDQSVSLKPRIGWSKSEDVRRVAQEAVSSMIESFEEEALRSFLADARIADLDDGYFWGLSVASAAGKTESHGCLRALMDAGVDVDAPIDEGYAALSRSADTGNAAAIHALCELGANVEARDERGRTPILLAAGCGHEEAIEALVKRGARLAVKDLCARSPVDLLLGVAEWQSRPSQRESAARSLVILLRAGARATPIQNLSMMAQIALAGNAEMIIGAVETGAVGVDDASGSGLTALMCCARAELFPSPRCVQVLLGLGARTDLVDARGFTALDYAIQSENKDIAQLIREAVADREALELAQVASKPRRPLSRKRAL